jgi:hypothetical protein
MWNFAPVPAGETTNVTPYILICVAVVVVIGLLLIPLFKKKDK